MIYLVSYRPLIDFKQGREAVVRHGYPPFVDSSCRREPDLQHDYPSITAICRRKPLAPRLQVGDRVVFVAGKGDYLGFGQPHWRLSAILDVTERFEDHDSAAEWYQAQDLPLPSNCVVDGNEPLPLEVTAAEYTINGKKHRPTSVEEWDDEYLAGARDSGVFLVTKPVFLELQRPPIITERDATDIISGSGMPNARAIAVLDDAAFEKMTKMCRIRL